MSTLFILGFWIIITAIFGIQLFVFTIKLEWPKTKLQGMIIFSYSILLVFPFISIFYFLRKLRYFFIKDYKIIQAGKKFSDVHYYKEKLDLLCKKLDIKNPPELCISRFYNLSPCILGLLPGQTFLILPYNFDEILEKISEGNCKLKSDLADFILVHELSHIFNKDIALISLIQNYLSRYYLFYWLSILLSLQILSGILIPEITRVILHFNWFIIFPMAITLVILHWLLTDIKKYRENYADARTSIFMDVEKLSRLTKKTRSREYLSPIESLFLYFKSAALYYSNESERKATKKFSRFPIPLQFSHYGYSAMFETIRTILFKPLKIREIDRDRNKNISKKEFLHETYSSPEKRISVYHGISTSILFYICYAVYSSLFFRSDNISVLLLIFIVIYSSFLFFLPLRNSVNKISNLSTYIKKVLQSYLISFLYFFLTSFILLFGSYFIQIIKPRLFFWIIYYGFDFAILIYFGSLVISLILVSVAAGENFEAMTMKDMVPTSIGVALALVIPSGIFLYLFHASYFFDLCICFFIAMIFLFILRPIGGALGEYYLSCNFYKYMFQVDYLRKGILKRISILVSFGGFFGLLVFIIPMLPFITLWQLTTLPNLLDENIKMLLLWLLIITFGVVAARGKPRTVHYMKDLTFLYGLLKINIPPTIREDFLYQVSLLKASDGGYKVKSFFTPFYSNIIATSSGTLTESILNKNNKAPDSAIRFVLSCQNSTGGFGIVPKTFSRLKTTYLGILSLFETNRLELINKNQEKHVHWIANCQAGAGNFSTFLDRYPPLEETFYAVSSLDMLGATDSINKNICSAWLIKQQSILKHEIEDVFFFTKTLDILGRLTFEKQVEIANAHFYFLEKKALNLRVDTNADKLGKYIELVKLLGLQNKSIIISKVESILAKDEKKQMIKIAKKMKKEGDSIEKIS
jgi:hypothetical protein